MNDAPNRPPLRCETCGKEWPQDEAPASGCTRCGGTTLSVTIDELTAGVGIDASYTGRGTDGKVVVKGHARRELTKDGPLAGTKAWVEQMVYKAIPGRYRKKVTLVDGQVVKDVDGPLTDQSLHGPQKKPSDGA